MQDRLEREVEERVEKLGFEFVELELAGSRARPILRVRIDKPDSSPGNGVLVEDCARVSRELESYLDTRGDLSERYMLEVSSAGIERPLVKRRDFERFAGRPVAIKGTGKLVEKSRRLEGELLGVEEKAGVEYVRLKLDSEEVVEVPRSEIARAHLIFRWDEKG
jgi:ribosome maturation factor RimP